MSPTQHSRPTDLDRPTVPTPAVHVWREGCDSDLFDLVERRGASLMLIGSSGATASRGRAQAAEDAVRAAEDLVSVAGLDVTHLLKEPGCMDEAMASMRVVRRGEAQPVTSSGSTHDGSRATTRSLHAQAQALPGGAATLVLLAGDEGARADYVADLVTGSGVGGSRDRVADVAVAGIFVTRADRVGHSMRSMVQVMASLSAVASVQGDEWSGDGRCGRWSHESYRRLILACLDMMPRRAPAGAPALDLQAGTGGTGGTGVTSGTSEGGAGR